MKNRLQNEALHALTLAAAKDEKSATLILLERLAEVDACRLYAVMGYASLWEYVHRALNYSESQASERVSAMRLIAKIPEIKNELAAGNLSLTTTAKLASHVRREKSPLAETLDLLKAVKGKPSREVERILCAQSTIPARPDQIRALTSETTRITLDVDQDFLDLIERVKELAGHPGSSTQDLLRLAMKIFVKRKEVKPQAQAQAQAQAKDKNNSINRNKNKNELETLLRAQKVEPRQKSLNIPSSSDSYPSFNSNSNPSSNANPNSNASVKLASSRYISVSIKTKIRHRSGDQCEYISAGSKRRCTHKMGLQFDHIVPFAMGGKTKLENLRHYCPAHNRLAAIQQFGEKKMREYMRH